MRIAAATVLLALLTPSLAIKKSDLTGLRGRKPANLKARAEALQAHELAKRHNDNDGKNKTNNGTSQSSSQYLNKNTEKFVVKSLPEVTFALPEMYSGSIQVDANNASAGSLFFVFVPKLDGEPVDEVTIWLNGGPGCSSLEGFWQENGPILWGPGLYAPVSNPYTWANLTNMLWVEQPFGTGFSQGPVTATSEDDITKPFVDFFRNWQTEFGVKNDSKIFVTGESYAGRYVPYISAALLDAQYNVSGALMYDPCIGEFDWVQEEAVAYPHIDANRNLWGLNETFMQELEALHKSCGYEDFINQYLTFPASGVQPTKFFNYSSDSNCDVFDIAFNEVFAVNSCFNPYEINTVCPLVWESLGFPGVFDYMPEGVEIYFNRQDVKQALHAPMNVNWSECSAGPVFVGDGGPQGEGDTSPDPIQGVLPRVIEATNRVLVANGDYDYIIITNGTLLAIQNMTWGGTLGFTEKPSSPFVVNITDSMYTSVFDASGLTGLNTVPQGTMGTYHYERGLMWVEVAMSGHMVPQYQPRVAYQQVQWMLGRIDSFN